MTGSDEGKADRTDGRRDEGTKGRETDAGRDERTMGRGSGSRTLVLFDIDGTLIDTARAGLRGMNAAIEKLYGHPDAVEGIPFAGRTDRAIFRDVFTRLDLEWNAQAFETARSTYFEQLAREIARPLSPPPADFGVLPGVSAALDAMDRDPSLVVALLTGNFERGAAIKLGYFGLWERFRFGAFGDEHFDRRDLVPLALARAADAGIAPTSVVVIGDTPLDVDCAQHHGAIAVAVATGHYDVAALTATGADLVLPTLESLDVRNLPALAR